MNASRAVMAHNPKPQATRHVAGLSCQPCARIRAQRRVLSIHMSGSQRVGTAKSNLEILNHKRQDPRGFTGRRNRSRAVSGIRTARGSERRASGQARFRLPAGPTAGSPERVRLQPWFDWLRACRVHRCSQTLSDLSSDPHREHRQDDHIHADRQLRQSPR